MRSIDSESTVFLVDDDISVRDAVGLFLESRGFEVNSYPSAMTFLDAYQSDWPGCLVLDINMPEIDGLRLQELLVEKAIEIPIIFLTGHGDVPQSARAFKAGAVDFIEKPFNDEEFLEAIQAAIKVDTENRQTKAKNAELLGRFSRLTAREQQVMHYVVAGKSNKEIGRELDISHRTIDIHRARIMEKMRADCLANLVAMAAACGLLNKTHSTGSKHQ